MRLQQYTLRHPGNPLTGLVAATDCQLVLAFGSPAYLAAPGFAAALAEAFPHAILAGCSTAGEISASGVDDETCTLTAVHFDTLALAHATTVLADMADSHQAGERLGQQLAEFRPDALLVFAPGLEINGSALIAGLSATLGPEIPLAGGLAGDGSAFRRTFTLSPDGVRDDTIVAIALRGSRLHFAQGSFGGWETFGPPRQVTRCSGNILHELDGEPALAVYKRYLGEHACALPASGLLFPFAIPGDDPQAAGLIRSILGIDEASGSLILAGDVVPGSFLKMMHASTEKLVRGADRAAALAQPSPAGSPRLALLVSCVGRKLVMGERVDEEIEAVAERLGTRARLTGFYSYGEIGPLGGSSGCHLHNQTMTVVCLGED